MWIARRLPSEGARWAVCLAGSVWTFLLLSCSASEGRDQNPQATVRFDSAGIEIVSNSRPLWSDVDAWQIADEPDLRIGSLEGGGNDVLNGVKAIRDLGDTILVAQSTELRLYRGDGSFIGRMGRAGHGPGEFFQVADALACGELIYASEQSPPQLLVFEPTGRSTTVRLPDPEQGLLNPLSPLLLCTPDGVIGALSGPPLPAEEVGSSELERRSSLAVHVRRDGSAIDTLISFPGPLTHQGLLVPFGSRTLVAAGDTLLYLSETGASEIRVLGLNGETRRVIRLDILVHEVTSADVERIRAQYVSGHSAAFAAELGALFDAIPVPATMPYFSDLKVAPDGAIWLHHYQAFRDEEMKRWTVLDPDGVWLGDVDMPDGFTVHEVGIDDVIGLWRDELGVEFIRRYPILK